MKKAPQLILASQSPRRRELLAQLGLEFQLASISVPEVVLAGESAADYVSRVARDKAEAGWKVLGPEQGLPVLGADTSVVVDDHILGKPSDAEDCYRMLALLSGRSHQVYTSIACAYNGQCEVEQVITEVTFDDISIETMRRYWQTGEPKDKAGSYAIQGFGALFVRKISGSYTGVVGLPLFETANMLSRYGVEAL